MFKKFNRMFFRGIMGAGRLPDVNNIEFERKLGKSGNSYRINIPPILVEELNLYEGVIVKARKDKLIITAIGKN